MDMKDWMPFFRQSAEEKMKKNKKAKPRTAPVTEKPAVPEKAAPDPEVKAPEQKAPDDGFTEWRRSQVRGGVERRERNDFYEAYSVYGADRDGQLTCRLYHRYPEHEREFGLSYSRTLSFDEFNTRLLSELDKGSISLTGYHDCIEKAERLTDSAADPDSAPDAFSESEAAAMRGFCETLDILKERRYAHSNGVFSCEGESVVGEETLYLRFRKPLRHDALGRETAGVGREKVYAYDIENLWIMSACNRLSERCNSYSITKLTSVWSAKKESVYLIEAKGFPGVEGTVLIAVGAAEDFFRFGFYSLDFSSK